MENIFVEKNRTIMKNYYETAWNLKDKIDDNNKNYLPEVAIVENQKLGKEQQIAYDKAVAGIVDNFNAVKELLARASVLDISNVPKEIDKKYKGSSIYNFNVDEVQADVEEYADNDDAIRTIIDWIDSKAQVDNGHITNKYADVKIVRPTDKLDAYKKFAENALYVIEQIHNDGTIMQRDTLTNERVSPLEIELYGDESNQKLYDIIGDGKALAENKTKSVPDRLLHVFDEVKPSVRNALVL